MFSFFFAMKRQKKGGKFGIWLLAYMIMLNISFGIHIDLHN